MSEVFVLRNQHGEYLNKQHEWLSSGDSKTLFRSTERDELINEKVELTVKSPDLRIKLIAAEQEQNGRITIDGKDCLPKETQQTDDAGNENQTELSLLNDNRSRDEAAPTDEDVTDDSKASITPELLTKISQQQTSLLEESDDYVRDQIDS